LRSLYLRAGRYYAHVKLHGKGWRFVPLYTNNEPVSCVRDAIEARDVLLADLRKGDNPAARRTPGFKDFQARYVKWLRETKAKDEKTIDKEEGHLKIWVESIGGTPISQITRRMINDHVQARCQKVCNRTANLDVLVLNNCLTFAKDEGILQHKRPTEDFKPLAHNAPKRTLKTQDDVDALVAEALKTVDGAPKYESGRMLADYILLMAYSGARRTGALNAKWEDVSFERNQITFHTKFDKAVTVDFNPKLKAHLEDMASRKLPDSKFLFPSSRSKEDKPLNNMSKTYEAVRTEAKLPSFNFHDLRHYFISWCVMSGIDTMTIARWVGHADGGVLIGKVYGHLANDHLVEQAKRLEFTVKKEEAPAEKPEPSKEQSGTTVTLDLSKVTVAELLAMVAAAQKPGQKAA
jgi:integrase